MYNFQNVRCGELPGSATYTLLLIGGKIYDLLCISHLITVNFLYKCGMRNFLSFLCHQGWISPSFTEDIVRYGIFHSLSRLYSVS
jgi:hypothetical protein